MLLDLFSAVAAGPLVVLSVEDVEHADPSTIEFLTELLAREDLTMLVILTGRLVVVSTLAEPDDLLELTGLNAGHAKTLARLVGPDLEESTIDRIVARSDGVPFFTEELARAAARTDGGALAETVELAGFLTARLDELDPELKHVLRPIAIAGGELALDVLREMTDLSQPRLDQLVSELHHRRVVVRTSAPTGDGVRFRHSLMRQAAYENILESRKTALHLRLANVLADSTRVTFPPEDVAAQFELGTIITVVEGYTSVSARGAFERAVTLAQSLEDDVAVLPALWGAWAYWLVLGEHAVAAPLTARCVKIAEEQPHHPELRLLASAINGYHVLYLGDLETADAELEWTTRLRGVKPPEVFPHDPVVVGIASRAVVQWLRGDSAGSRALAEDALEQLHGLDPAGRRTSLTQCFVGCLLAWRAELDGDPQAAIELADQSIAIATERGYPTWIAAGVMHRSIGCAARTDTKRAYRPWPPSSPGGEPPDRTRPVASCTRC